MEGISLEGQPLQLRRDLRRRGLMEENETSYLLKEDQIFPSPSAAAKFVLGRIANGWTEWKDEEGSSIERYL